MLPIELKPLQDEILSSWLIRNSLANGSDPLSWVAGIWFDYRAWTRDIDRHLDRDKIASLSKLTSLTSDDIFDMTLESDIVELLNGQDMNLKKAWIWVIPTGIRNRTRTNGSYFCPQCLTDDNAYLKKQWRLSWNVACDKHQTLLHLSCPNCDSVFSPYFVDYKNVDIGCCHRCGFDLKTIRSKKVDSRALQLQEYLNRMIYIDEAYKPKYLDRDRKEFFTTIRVLLLFFRQLNRYSETQEIIYGDLNIDMGGTYFEPHKGDTLDSIGVEERHHLLMAVSRLLEFTLEEMIVLFRHAKVSRQMFLISKKLFSSTVMFIADALDDRGKSSYYRKGTKSIIEPNSKEVVETLMDDIRKYL